ncbi:uncharacterized protein VTP21DRAFT_6539 [Calcarisporiella thermophila]|uniref:uncharacterized protein n=1 Tax=Calcarisporiella thermophila TaxID=911321 RepID=UPI00374356D7
MDNEDHVDYYELLGVTYNSTSKEISKAYRLKALKYHPDKNKDEGEAVKIFHQLTKAYETLTDAQKKLEYDNVLKARAARKQKTQKLDIKRRQMKVDLEEKEREAKRRREESAQEDAQIQAEIYRLRTEKLRKREEEEESRIAAEARAKSSAFESVSELDRTLKMRWKKKDHTFSQADISQILANYGEIEAVAISAKKGGSALVVFKTIVAAHHLMTRRGRDPTLTPFTEIGWASGVEPEVVQKLNAARTTSNQNQNTVPIASASIETPLSPQKSAPSIASKPPLNPPSASSFPAPPQFSSAPDIFNSDYEAITLMRMRQAERDKLTREIKRQEEAESV